MKPLFLSLVICACAFAQSSINGDRVTLGAVDNSGATSTKPSKSGLSSAIPATCSVGMTYFKTDATAGSNLFGCTSTNVWTLQGGGGGSSTAEHVYTFGSTAAIGPVGGSPGAAVYSKTLTAGELAPGKCMTLQFSIAHTTSASGINYDLDVGGQKFALFNAASGDVSTWIWPFVIVCNNNALVTNQISVAASPFQYGTGLNLTAQNSFGTYATATVDMTISQAVAVYAYGGADFVAGRGFRLSVGQ